jgi:hypothetical protein
MTMKKMLKGLIKTEKGQALPMVLILMVVGGLILAPLLSYSTEGLKVSQAYESMADEFYAADAGIEDGLWQIKYDHLKELFSNYERYDYDATYEYPILYPVEVNDMDVEVEIENIWIPDIEEPATLAEANWLAGTDKLIIAGCVPAELTQQVKIHYKKEEGDPEQLFITSIGIWLPPGYSYDGEGEDSAALEEALAELGYALETDSYKGGEAVVWSNFSDPPSFTAPLPGVREQDNPMTCTLNFNFKRDNPESRRNPAAVSWLTTSPFIGFTYTWDADIRVFHIKSFAKAEDSLTDGTTIDAYAIKSDPRQLVSGINGDYRATGNTLMLDLLSNPPYERDKLLSESAATVNDIPANAHVDAAFLYWSAFLEPGEEQETLFIDTCDDIHQYWDPGSDWSDYHLYSTYAFQAHHNPDGDPELVMKEEEARELGIYEPGTVTVSLDYRKGGQIEIYDCLEYAFYNEDNGWSDWETIFCDDQGPDGAGYMWKTKEIVVPEEYLTANFRMKFQIEGFAEYGETCYIDNIKVTVETEEEIVADTEIRLEIGEHGQVYLEDDEYGNPTVPAEGTESIFAKSWTLLENDNPQTGQLAGYSYACKADITPLVQAYTEHGNETYTVGDVYGDVNSLWSYAGWSLIIIYSSPETQRHQLYLFDDFLYLAPHEAGLSFPISGFLVPDPITDPDTGEITEETAATITCFVGDGDDYWSGDFIAINPEPEGAQGPEIANKYKLFDGIELYAEWGWPWPGMDNTKYGPNNVWNSRSEGFEGDGVDIDTFYVTWESGLIAPGDSSAKIVISYASTEPPTGYGGAELIDFIYIIIAFRSEAVTGGTVTYLIEG